jgi:murein L,D-transpeptidase YafK
MITTLKTILIAFLLVNSSTESFKQTQLKFARVKDAFEEKEGAVKELFRTKGFEPKGQKIFLRAFKKEAELEVWIKHNDSYQLLVVYPFCTTSGTLGPKRREGDLQIPEGVYHINHFNPYSTFHLSLGINYPNASDRILSDKRSPGGAIYIHGNCVSIGCIPITDDKIKELYLMAVEARNAGQEKIPVHIFPARLDDGVIDELAREFQTDAQTTEFWANLKEIYVDFESTRRLRNVRVNAKGRYYF